MACGLARDRAFSTYIVGAFCATGGLGVRVALSGPDEARENGFSDGECKDDAGMRLKL